MNWKTLLCSLIVITSVCADDFKSANALFDAGKFPDAIAAYQKVEPKTANAYFNLGNAYYRDGQVGRAILNYERARQLEPTDPDILANLRFSEEKLNVVEANESPHPVTRFIQSVANSRTLAEWCRYEIVGMWLTILLVAGAIWWSRWRSGLVILAVLAGVELAGSAGLVIYRKVAPPVAVVVATKVDARFAPLADATVHFQLDEGTQVVVRENRGQWWLVERADEQQGWVRADAVEQVWKP